LEVKKKLEQAGAKSKKGDEKPGIFCKFVWREEEVRSCEL
jgi:hypothetical protein